MVTVWDRLLTASPKGPSAPATPADWALAARDSGVVAPLPHLGLLHLAGPDTREFLQNQLTQSVADLADTETRLAAWCSAKGRARAVFRVIPSDTGLVLLADADTLEAIRPKLQMFILRAQVAITDLSADEGLMGVTGPVAETVLTETTGTLPRADNELVRAGDLHVIRVPGHPAPRYLVLAPEKQLAALWERYRAALTPTDPAFWQLLDIQAGLPTVTPATMERFVPTMLNLEPLGGISYTKGCYPGQEVVARMHYLGKLKRRLYRARLGDDPPLPGSAVTLADGTEAGEVVSAALSPEQGSELLTVLRIEMAEREDLQVDGRPLQLLDLPYPPPGESA